MVGTALQGLGNDLDAAQGFGGQVMAHLGHLSCQKAMFNKDLGVT